MKMEVLSAVQNHQYQGQFGVIGSTKVKDWTSPLTPPPPPPPLNQQHNHHHQHHPVKKSQQQQQQQLQEQEFEELSNSGEVNADAVDGRPTSAPHYHQQQHHNYYRNQHHGHTHHLQHTYLEDQAAYNNQQVTTAMEAATAAVEGSAAAAGNTARYAYNNNLLYCDATVAIAAANTSTLTPDGSDLPLHARFGARTDDVDEAAVRDLSQQLQAELRAAKSRHLACTEVSLPWDLMPRIAADIVRTSEREPCGIRGCSIFIEFEDEPNNTRRIASFKVDPNTVSTFELYLTLKNDRSGWTSKLPQFLKNLTRSSTIQISPDFTLTKNKLYSFE